MLRFALILFKPIIFLRGFSQLKIVQPGEYFILFILPVKHNLK